MPIFVTEFGIAIEAKDIQLLKAKTPITFTESGILTEVRETQFSKA